MELPKGDSFCPLDEAILSEDFLMVKLLIESGADVKGRLETAMLPYYRNDCERSEARNSIMRLLIDNGEDITKCKPYIADFIHRREGFFYSDYVKIRVISPVGLALKDGDVELALSFIEKGIPVMPNDLRYAIEANETEIAQYIIKKASKEDDFTGKVRDYYNTYPFLKKEKRDTGVTLINNYYIYRDYRERLYLINIAMENKNYEIAKLLIENKLFTDEDIFFATYSAIHQNNLEMVKLFVENGIRFNDYRHYPNYNYNFPLGECVAYDRVEIAKYLIEKGANVQNMSGDYSVSLETCLINKQVEMAELLIENGLKLDEYRKYTGNKEIQGTIKTIDQDFKNKDNDTKQENKVTK